MGKRILFIDGDQTIVEKVNTMLEEMGHQVRMETSGMDALAAFSGNPTGFDLVITDLGMPDISGLRLATRLLKIRGDIPIVLLTGLDGEQLSKARQTGIQWFGMKPISIPALADTVRSALMEAVN
jgi:two-component system, cell cycle sensor histidine kinase and response regulator CckA